MIARATALQERVHAREYLTLSTHKSSMNSSVLHLSLRENPHLKLKTKNNASITNLLKIAKESN